MLNSFGSARKWKVELGKCRCDVVKQSFYREKVSRRGVENKETYAAPWKKKPPNAKPCLVELQRGLLMSNETQS